MLIVDIYITTTVSGPRIEDGWYGYALEYTGKAGKYERLAADEEKEITSNQLALVAVIRALERLTKPCNVNITLKNAHAISCFDRLDIWAAAGWKNSKGEQVKNLTLWKRLYQLRDKHEIDFMAANLHNYTFRLMQMIEEERRKKQIREELSHEYESIQ